MRECPFCGRYVAEQLTLCPFCREALPASAPARRPHLEAGVGGRQVRRGLVYMLLAAVIDYFAGGYSGLEFPYSVIPIVTQYLLPLLFVSGMGLTLLGLYRRFVA